MNYIVYAHTNKFNHKIYIGITSTSVNKRWRNGLGYYNQYYFYNAIFKYGWDGFYHEILASGLNKENALNLEKFLIKILKSNNSKYGYNIS